MIIKLHDDIINLDHIERVSIEAGTGEKGNGDTTYFKMLTIYFVSGQWRSRHIEDDSEAQRFYDWYSNRAKSFDEPSTPRDDKWEYEA